MANAGLCYEQLDDAQVAELNTQLAGKEALDVVRWAYDQFGDDLVYACSFGAEAMVLIDLIDRVKPDARLVFLDTDVHFPETYALIERVSERYPRLNIERVRPALTLEEQAKQYGEALWSRDPDACCRIRKVEPMARALSGVRAWMSGLRREQSPTRAKTEFVNLDHKFRSIKICPLIHWTWKDVWTYIVQHGLPYNPLHDQGYPSIGCRPCTQPTGGREDSRAGRWAGFGKTECGLHA
ncbi:MAG: phosphoadenosine phosphosulfate reductase [Bacillaceae bacterium G1]|nr:phosphoadenylyl-sulfate reductase [Bacillota bacterium]OJF17664.1 MAG: phosphoadenosine phosphosulfate reductase [Bacillaceae bacterium G1]